MHWINWLIVVVYLAYVIIDGIRRSKDTDTIHGYFLASKSLPWWVVGLSVMATQLSAVTMIGTPGQGATSLGQGDDQRAEDHANPTPARGGTVRVAAQRT